MANKRRNRAERRRQSAERRHKHNVVKNVSRHLREGLTQGMTQQEIRRLVDENETLSPDDFDDVDNAEKWALMQEYYDLVNAGLIVPELSPIQVYNNINYFMPQLLNERGLKTVIERGNRKRKAILANEAEREQRVREFANTIIDF